MTGTRPHLEPGPDHPITVEPAGRRIKVRAGVAGPGTSGSTGGTGHPAS